MTKYGTKYRTLPFKYSVHGISTLQRCRVDEEWLALLFTSQWRRRQLRDPGKVGEIAVADDAVRRNDYV